MGGGGGGRLFEAGRLLTFSAFRVGANSRVGAYSNKYDMSKGIAQVIANTLVSLPINKCSCRVVKKISKRLHQGLLALIFFG